MFIVSLQTPLREGLEILSALAGPGSNPGSGTIRLARSRMAGQVGLRLLVPGAATRSSLHEFACHDKLP